MVLVYFIRKDMQGRISIYSFILINMRFHYKVLIMSIIADVERYRRLDQKYGFPEIAGKMLTKYLVVVIEFIDFLRLLKHHGCSSSFHDTCGSFLSCPYRIEVWVDNRVKPEKITNKAKWIRNSPVSEMAAIL